MSGSKDQNEVKWNQFWGSIAVSALCHPLEYAKVLIQIGHEPIAPRPTKTILGKPVLILPSVFQYVGYIKSVDGVTGCFRGLGAKVCANIVNGFTMQIVTEHIENKRDKYADHDLLPDNVRRQREFLDNLSTQLISHAAAVMLSHPFQVVGVRMMAQFVGGEEKYRTITGAFAEIYQREGFFGFFAGVFPRLIGDLLTVMLTAALGTVIYRCLPDCEDMRNYATAVAGFVSTSITYPFGLMSNCMIVSSSGLIAGTPPRMPEYKSWVHCCNHLYRTNQLKRGSSLLWRYYKGPVIHLNGQLVMLNKDEFASTAKLRD